MSCAFAMASFLWLVFLCSSSDECVIQKKLERLHWCCSVICTRTGLKLLEPKTPQSARSILQMREQEVVEFAVQCEKKID